MDLVPLHIGNEYSIWVRDGNFSELAQFTIIPVFTIRAMLTCKCWVNLSMRSGKSLGIAEFSEAVNDYPIGNVVRSMAGI